MSTRATIKQFFNGDEPNIELISSWCHSLKRISPAALTSDTLTSFKRYYAAFSPVVTQLERAAMSDYLLTILLLADGSDVKLWISAAEHFKQWKISSPGEFQPFLQERLNRCTSASEMVPLLANIGRFTDNTLVPPKFKVATKSMTVPAKIPYGIGNALEQIRTIPAWSNFIEKILPLLILAGIKIQKKSMKLAEYQYATQAFRLCSEMQCMEDDPRWIRALVSACSKMTQPVQQDMLAAFTHIAKTGINSPSGWLDGSSVVIDSCLDRIEDRLRAGSPASGTLDSDFVGHLLVAQRIHATQSRESPSSKLKNQRLFAAIDFWSPLLPSPTPKQADDLTRLNQVLSLFPLQGKIIWNTCFRLPGDIKKDDVLKILSAPGRSTRPTYALLLSNNLPLNDAIDVFNAYIRMGEQTVSPPAPNSYVGDIIAMFAAPQVQTDIKDAVLQDNKLKCAFLLNLMAGHVLRIGTKAPDPAFPDVDFTPFVRLHRLYPDEMPRWIAARNLCYVDGRSTGPNQAAFAALYEFYTGERSMTPEGITQMAQALSMPAGDYLAMTLGQVTPDTMALPLDLDALQP
jgi:hypothetical protein